MPEQLMSRISSRLEMGADVQRDGSTHFRVWAPRPRDIRLVIEQRIEPRIERRIDPRIEPASRPEREVPLAREGDGYFSARVPDVGAGARYRYRLDGRLLADPASRCQPEGPFGPSHVVDPAQYAWKDRAWRGVTIEGQVLSELHLGTFTPEGTWGAAAARLPDVKAIGVTTVEVMPVAECPGRFGWGYDAVFPYAPCRIYGTPDDFRYLEIRVLTHSFDQEVHMVGHEAVRKNCKLVLDASAQNLLDGNRDAVCQFEVVVSLERAERQEIAVKSTVIECRELAGIVRHGRGKWQTPRRR